MERTCNSCQKQKDCVRCQSMSEREGDELSCVKYEAMELYQYIGLRQERLRAYMAPISADIADRIFKKGKLV